MSGFLKNSTYINSLKTRKPFLWTNPSLEKASKSLKKLSLTINDIRDVQARLYRFAPALMELFSEIRPAGGIIESPLLPVGKMQKLLNCSGRFLLKADHDLPLAGSIKARGGIYEVLHFAETLAIKKGLLKYNDNYAKLAGNEARKLFGKYTVSVGSTGNLGLSIGVISSALGFGCQVHMSSDAKEWKKERLRKRGVTVVEHKADYSAAVEEARKMASKDKSVYFVDDENSVNLFLGYANAAFGLKNQLESLNIKIDETHPLFVYLPCGVGGAPGGITFGLKALFGDAAHCFMAEPVESPCMTLGLVSGKHSGISVYDIGLTNRTDADGLAVSCPSGFVGKFIEHLVSGSFTLEDDAMYKYVCQLDRTESLRIEPSAAAGIAGPDFVLNSAEGKKYLKDKKIRPENITHIAWTTGGRFVPDSEMNKFIKKGVALLKNKNSSKKPVELG